MLIVLEKAMERMLRSTQSFEGVELVKPHWDARLRGRRRKCSCFMKALLKVGIVSCLRGGSAKEDVGMFFVKKTGKNYI